MPIESIYENNTYVKNSIWKFNMRDSFFIEGGTVRCNKIIEEG